MLLSQISLLAFAAAVAAQLANLPSCARTCVGELPPECQALDIGCMCRSDGWLSGVSCCVSKECESADEQKAIEVATNLCKTVGVQVPQAASCPGDANSASATLTSASAEATGAAASNSTSDSGSVSSGADTTGPSASQTSGAASSVSAAAAAPGEGAAAPFAGPGMAFAGVAVAALALL